MPMPAHFRTLFYPKSIAIIGASHTPGTVGYSLLQNVLQQGFNGKVYPINIKGGTILGLPVKRQINHITDPVDLAVIAVPAQYVPSVLEEAGQKGVKAAVVISAGFKEIGKKELEAQLVAVAKKYDITLIGPNCLGFINPEIMLNASFANIMPKAGNIAFMSQSGALCSTVLDYAKSMGLGFSKFMSIGNKASVGELEILEYLYHDPKTAVIMMYVEELEEAQKMISLAREITHGKKHKPILMLKSGRTAAGSQASQSHTGSLGGSDAAYSALCAQSGIIRVDSISELFNLAECFSENKLIQGNKVAIITNAGGPGVLVTDSISSMGLELAQLTPNTITHLSKHLPISANTHNPIDILGDAKADRYELAIKAVAADPNVDGIILILTPQAMTEIEATAKVIIAHKKNIKKPLIITFMGAHSVEKANTLLNEAGFTTTTFPEPAAKALSMMNYFREWLKVRKLSSYRFTDVHTNRIIKLIDHEVKDKNIVLDVETSSKLLGDYGFTVLKSRLIENEDQARRAVNAFMRPVVLKIVSPDIIHKTDAGGVELHVAPQDIPKKYKEVLARVKARQPRARLLGIQAVEMMDSRGIDLILGMTTDPKMGKLIAVGLGGIYTEVLKDVAWGIAPLTKHDTDRMIHSLRAHPIFEGLRGQPPLDTEELTKMLGRLSQLALKFPQIKEIDMNPVRVLPEGEGVKVLDARVILFEQQQT